MTQTETAWRKTFLIRGADGIRSCIAVGVRVCGQRRDKWVENVGGYGNHWRAARHGQEYLELEDGGRIWTCSPLRSASLSLHSNLSTFAYKQDALPDVGISRCWRKINAIWTSPLYAGAGRRHRSQFSYMMPNSRTDRFSASNTYKSD